VAATARTDDTPTAAPVAAAPSALVTPAAAPDPDPDTASVAQPSTASAPPNVLATPRSVAPPAAVPTPPPPTITIRPWQLVAAGIVALVALGGFVALARTPVAAPLTTLRVELEPFEPGPAVAGEASAGLQELLAIRLAGAGVLALPVGLAGAEHAAVGERPPASRIHGELTDRAGQLTVNATLNDGRRRSREISARGTLPQVADELGAALLRRLAIAGAAPDLAELTTSNAHALSSYLAGRVHARAGSATDALAAFREAVAQDSTFALANYALAAAYLQTGDTRATAHAAQAARFSSRLPEAHRRSAQALQQFLRGYVDEAEHTYAELLELQPFDADGWYALGEIRFRYNPLRGRSIFEARVPLERAFALAATDATRRRLLALAALAGDEVTLERLARDLPSGSLDAQVARALRVLSAGTAAERSALLADIAALPPAHAATLAWSLAHIADDRAATAALRRLRDPGSPAELRVLAYLLLAHVEAGAGRLRAADRELAAAAALDDARALVHRAFFASLPFVPAAGTRLTDLRRGLALTRSARPNRFLPGEEALDAHLRLYFAGLLNARQGNTVAAESFARQTETLRANTEATSLGRDLARGIRARIALERGDHTQLLAQVEATRVQRIPLGSPGPLPFQSLAQERYLRGDALRRAGRREEALQWYAAIAEDGPFSRVFRAPAHLRQAEIHEELGDFAGAAFHYQRAAELWHDADAELRPLATAARRRAQRLRS
jgi:hypothetical protein